MGYSGRAIVGGAIVGGAIPTLYLVLLFVV